MQRFPQDMSERTIREAKKPNFCSHNPSFSPIINPVTFLEISAVPEYFSTTFISTLWKFKRSGFHDRQKGQIHRRKPRFFIFLNMRIKIGPQYSRTAEISKKVTVLIIGEKLWLWEQKFGFLASRIARSGKFYGNRSRIVKNNLRRIIFGKIPHYSPMYPKCQTNLKSDKNCGL